MSTRVSSIYICSAHDQLIQVNLDLPNFDSREFRSCITRLVLKTGITLGTAPFAFVTHYLPLWLTIRSWEAQFGHQLKERLLEVNIILDLFLGWTVLSEFFCLNAIFRQIIQTLLRLLIKLWIRFYSKMCRLVRGVLKSEFSVEIKGF